ncbi:hypothetical protein [Thermococcus sp. Bubb.Bath]|uniref:hypothetical protein n=1 Tax=Thermococcus sp. Bubb.Bath TaxID=1638242 RepID=UPI00143A9242|nr:hypothetical protein [Thermococcus sp. Bubb.Bath]NJF24419.1 hypothetical protein [Thermococcus sp. Bubb.Bath]
MIGRMAGDTDVKSTGKKAEKGISCFSVPEKIAMIVLVVLGVATIPVLLGLFILAGTAGYYFKEKKKCRLMMEQARLIAASK